MNRNLRNWIASPAEARTAWFVAAICVVLIATAFILPGIQGPAPKANAVHEDRHVITAENHEGENHSNSIEKLIEKVQQEDAPAASDDPIETVNTEPEPAPAPKPETVTTKPKPTPARKPASANTTITESSDTTSIAAILAQAQMNRPATLPKGYYVQLGAFSKQSGAETLQKKLSAKLDNTHVQKKSNGMYAVWAGPYATRKLAEQAKPDITRRTGIKGYTVSN